MWPRNDMKLMEKFGGHTERTYRALWKSPWHVQLKESLAANLARYLLHRAAMAMQVREKGRAISACLAGKRGACRDATGQALWASHGFENGQPPAVRLMCCDRQRRDWETAIREAARVCELQSLAWPVTGRELSFRAWDCGSAQTQTIADETSLSVLLERPDPNAPDGLRASLCQSRVLPPHRDSFRDDCKHKVSLATGDA
ncbi:hypothetical protein CI238_03199 [Colletotrichum incanum]|uniref:Uncharacterized protein n=1 Tax=Colletotrichum incanum TaxID=1573173 RepID=A0A161XZ86_COLIC|nr:hypothetical protein CI238_03199 [Colletotrichum incanum]